MKDYWENALSLESQISLRLPKNGQTTKKKCACKALGVRNCGLHPLIHTFPYEDSAQNVGGAPERAECGLKYVIQTFRRTMWTLDIDDFASNDLLGLTTVRGGPLGLDSLPSEL